MSDSPPTNSKPDSDTAELNAPKRSISYGDKTLIAPDYETNPFFPEPETNPVPPAGTGTFPRGSIFAPGDVFLEKYEILRPIGAGGMGSVFQARHVKFPKMYAIKVINPNLMEDTTIIQRFEREARTMAEVEHRNAVTIFDYGAADGICYLVMEFLRGETLRQRLKRGGRFDAETLKDFTEQMCCVLGVMHRKKITHRDLKPENIFFHRDDDRQEVLKVLDFGIAKFGASLGNMTNPGAVIGTPDYMSPEQCHGDDIDGRSDLYALGIIFFEILTGVTPFDNDNPMTVMYRQVNEPAPDPRRLNPDIPERMARVILKMLDKRPHRRFANAHDVMQAVFEAYGDAPPASIETIGTAPLTARDTAAELEAVSEAATIEVAEISEAATVEVATPPLVPVEETPKAIEKPAPSPASPRTEPRARRFLPAAAGLLIATIGTLGFLFRALLFPVAPPAVAPTPARIASVPIDEFVLIPGGSATIGRNADECGNLPKAECNIQPEEMPAHQVTLPAYYLGRTEVTNRQYLEFVKATGHPAPPDWVNNAYPTGTDDLPVTRVSWNDADAYCRWRAQRDKLDIRLPTEDEWEHAARGTDNRRYPWGNDWRTGAADVAMQNATTPKAVTDISGGDKTSGGIIGMAGNVSEWTASMFNPYPGSSYKATSGDLACRVVRGGSIRSLINTTRTSYRAWNQPKLQDRENGFRLAVTPPRMNAP